MSLKKLYTLKELPQAGLNGKWLLSFCDNFIFFLEYQDVMQNNQISVA